MRECGHACVCVCVRACVCVCARACVRQLKESDLIWQIQLGPGPMDTSSSWMENLPHAEKARMMQLHSKRVKLRSKKRASGRSLLSWDWFGASKKKSAKEVCVSVSPCLSVFFCICFCLSLVSVSVSVSVCP